MNKLVKIDDIGASTKYYNQRGEKIIRIGTLPIFYFPFADFWFFKRIWPFAKWAKYEELTAEELKNTIKNFKKRKIIPIFAITATWVEKNGELTPYPKKFPEQAAVLRRAYKRSEIIIANHGLTHCIPGKHLPTMFGSNRRFHREFWPELPQKWHNEHIRRSQRILENWFGKKITIFVPPGNVWSKKTYNALLKTNIKTVISNRYMLDSTKRMKDIIFRLDKNYFNFHDRELKKYGLSWLVKKTGVSNEL